MRITRALGAGAVAVLAMGVPATAASASSPAFRPVHTLAGQPTSITAVGRSDVWSAGKTADGQVLLQHVTNGRLRTQVLPVEASDDLAIHGSSADDVWLVSGGELWHYTGRAWRQVALPEGFVAATAVFDVPGRNVYVGAYEHLQGQFNDTVAQLFRYDGRTWTSLGGPEWPDGWDQAGTEKLSKINVVGKKVFAESHVYPPASMTYWAAYEVDGTTWTRFARTGEQSPANNSRMNAWIVNSTATSHLFLGIRGLATDPMPQRPDCMIAVVGQDPTSCTTSTAVGDAAKFSNGTVVIGGNDWRSNNPGEPEAWQQGSFVLRSTNGTERKIGGDPGDETLDMAVDPSGRIAWALTRSGDTYTLQKYDRYRR